MLKIYHFVVVPFWLSKFADIQKKSINITLVPLYALNMNNVDFKSGFFLPTGGLKPPPTGSGLPDRFDRLPEKTGQIQNPNQKLMFNQFRSASRPVGLVYRSGLTGYWCFKFKIACSTGSDRLTDRFDRSGLTGYRCFNKKFRRFWSGP